jgi:hypothetical protein
MSEATEGEWRDPETLSYAIPLRGVLPRLEKLNPRWQDLAKNWEREMRCPGQSLARIP